MGNPVSGPHYTLEKMKMKMKKKMVDVLGTAALLLFLTFLLYTIVWWLWHFVQ